MRISLLHEEETTFLIETIKANAYNVTHKTSSYKKQQFENFVSKASRLLLQRLLVLRGLEYELAFTTLDENNLWSKLIFNPQVASIEDQKLFNIECCIVPEVGDISVWNYNYSFDGSLVYGHSYSTPIKLKQSNVEIHPKCSSDDLAAITRPVTMFGNGKLFVESVDIEDLAQVLFEETLNIVTHSGLKIGTHRIFIEEHLNLPHNRHLCTFTTSTFELDGKTYVISNKGTISTALETLEQTIEENVYEDCRQLFHRKAIIKKLPTRYSVFQRIQREEKQCEREFFLDIEQDMPFITESSCVLLDRLMIQKRLDHSLRFITLNSSLSVCYLSYYVLPSEWSFVKGVKCEVFCVRRDIIQYPSKSSSRKIIQWKLSFSQQGYCIEQEQLHQSLKFVAFESRNKDCSESPGYPMALSFEPPFQMSVSTLEVKAITFNDHLSVLCDNNQVVGHYSATVDVLKYQGKDAFFIEVYLFASIEDNICGTISTAYVDLNFQIQTATTFEFFKTKKKKIQQSISFTKEDECYNMQLMRSENSVSSHGRKKWCLPTNTMYVCEASSILLQRLITLRKFKDPVEAIAFDVQGNALAIQLSSQGLKQLDVLGNTIDAVEVSIRFSNDDGQKAEFSNWKTILSSSGHCLSREQSELLGIFVHSYLISKDKITIPNEIYSSELSLSAFIICSNITADVLHPFEFCDLEPVLSAERLDILYSEENVGFYSMNVLNVHQNQQHCLLVQTYLSVDSPNWKLTTSQCDLMLPNLKIIKHTHTSIIEKENLFLEEKIFLEMISNQCMVRHCIKHSKESNFLPCLAVFNDIDGFVTEASCLLFQKSLVNRNICGRYHFLSINEKQNLCRVEVNSLGWKMQTIHKVEVRTFEIKVQVTPFKKCTRLCQNYFSPNGVLLMCVRGVFILKKSSEYIDPVCSLDHSILLKSQLQSLQFIDPEDLDEVLFLDEGPIIYKGTAEAGRYRALVNSIHYEGQHCFLVCLSSNISLLGKECSTTMRAILDKKLQIIQYALHDFSDPDKDAKIFIRYHEDTYEIENLHLQDKKIIQKTCSIKVKENSNLCCEALSIVVVRLMAQKKIENSIELLTVGTNGDLCHTVFTCVGVKNVEVFGEHHCNALKITSETRNKERHLMTWNYWLSKDGHLLSRQQVGVPLLIVASKNNKA